jgi:hypothetical protein
MEQRRNAFMWKLTTSILTVMVLLSISIPVASAQLSLGGGADLIFMDDFETGNLSTWDRVKDDSGDLIVRREAVYQGEWGLEALIDDRTPIYAIDRFPALLERYRARFYINIDSLNMVDETGNPIFAGKDLDNQWDFVVVLGKNRGPNHYIRVQALTDDGARFGSARVEIGAGWHSIEIEWVSGLPGGIKLWIDGSLKQTLELNNSARSLARSYLGAFGGIDATTSGSIYFDNFESRKTTYIGGDVLQDASK